MEIKIINSESGLYALDKIWNDLFGRCANPSVPQSWEWISAWHQVYGSERKPWIFAAYENQRLVGLAPLAKTRKSVVRLKCLPFRSAWLLGSGPTQQPGILSEYLGFLIENGREDEFSNLFCKWLTYNQEWEEILLDNIAVDSSIFLYLLKNCKRFNIIVEELQRTPSHFIRLPASWEDYLKSISGNFRYKIIRGRKELDQIGARFLAINSQNDLERAIRDLIETHQSRWQNRGEPGSFANGARRKFHLTVLPALLDRGFLKMRRIEAEGRTLAVNYNFGIGGRIHYFQSGMVEHPNRHIRPGLLLHSYCIQEAIEEGCFEYDFLKEGKAGAGYKQLWSNEQRDLICLRLARPTAKEKLYRILRKIEHKSGKIMQNHPSLRKGIKWER